MRIDGVLRRLLAFGMLISLSLISGCDNTGEVDPVRHDSLEGIQISLVEAPSLWVYGSDTFRNLSVRLDIDESMRDAVLVGEVPSPAVWVRIVPSAGDPIDIQLLDDGSALTPSATDSFLAPSSGDLVAHDFLYTVRLNSGFAATEGEFDFEFVAAGADSGDTTYNAVASQLEAVTLNAHVTVAVNRPPILDGEGSSLPDSLYSGFDTQLWSLLATDPDAAGGDIVTDVNLQVLRNDVVLRNLILTDSGNNLWTLRTDSSFNSGIATGDVLFRFMATDRFGETSLPLDTTVWIENTAPVLSDAVAPDSVFIPSVGADDNTYTLSVRVSDSQGPGDLSLVYYTVEDPHGVVSEEPDFIFADNGILPDEVAGDGIWTTGISVSSGNVNTGTWIFRFYGKDRAGNISDPVEVPIVMEHTP
ncbi:MAG: hypothetical protein V2A56_12305 [bacterium]